jgi:hypothetical protein
MKSKIFARQGDIGILYANKETPEGKKPVVAQDGQLTLGHGAATGQRHTVSAEDAELYEHGQDLLLIVKKDTPMLHPEHDNKVIPVGSYIVRRQREQFQEEARYVAD